LAEAADGRAIDESTELDEIENAKSCQGQVGLRFRFQH
jgi:hypothetical protein